MNVLIADDSELFRTRLVSVVTELDGFEVVSEAGNVPAALDALQRARPDLILLDIEMPGGDSLDVVEQAKGGQDAIALIVLTAFPFPQYRRQFLAAGADHFFDKATEFERMVEVLREMRGREACQEDEAGGSGDRAFTSWQSPSA